MRLVLFHVGLETAVLFGGSVFCDPEPTRIGATGTINFRPKSGDGRIGEHLALLTLNVALPAIASGAGVFQYRTRVKS